MTQEEQIKVLVDALNAILTHDRVNNNYADTCSAMRTVALKALTQTKNIKQ